MDIGKINVVVGKNSTGKSTSSKFLFSLLTSVSEEGIQLANNDICAKILNFIEYWSLKGSQSMKQDLNKIKNILLNKHKSQKLFEDIYLTLNKTLNKNDFKDKQLCLDNLNDLSRIIEINNNESKRFNSIFNSLVESEFGCSLAKFENAQIDFEGNYNGQLLKQGIFLDADKNQVIGGDFLIYFNFQNVIYIDSPSILDGNTRNSQYHLHVLEKKLKKIKNPNNIYDDDYFKDLNKFKCRIDELIGGNFEYVVSEDVFIFKKDGEIFSMQNTASGLKQLGVIQLLLGNNELTKNTFLILDEPEVNLHPEFQVILSELLVIAVKELNISLFVNTHSPFFAEAMEAYSRYYGLLENTNFYLTQEFEKTNRFDYNLLDNDEILEVYDNLGNPFDIIHKVKVQADIMHDLGD